MKKLILLALLTVASCAFSNAQTVLFFDNFNAYDSTSGANYNGWNLTYVGPFSYYTSTQSSGPSGPNSYKFGFDSATAISPSFANADSIIYWTKGNGTDSISKMYVYTTPDGVNYTLLDSYTYPNPQSNLPGSIKRYALPAGTTNVKFFYDKSVGNMAFDDFTVIKNASSINSIGVYKAFTLFPNRSTGSLVQLTLAEASKSEPIIKVFNRLGGELKSSLIEKTNTGKYTLNLTNEPSGFYFIKVQTDKGLFTQRLTVN